MGECPVRLEMRAFSKGCRNVCHRLASSAATWGKAAANTRPADSPLSFPNAAGGGATDVIGQQPGRQETLLHKLGRGISDAGHVFSQGQPLAWLKQPEPRPSLGWCLALIADAIAVHVDKLPTPVQRFRIDAVERSKGGLLEAAPRLAVGQRMRVVDAVGAGDVRP